MIVFDSTTWTISLPPGESVIGRQYDNMTRSILNQSENDETNGIPYLKFQCTEPDKFQFQPGTVVRIHGEGRMK